MDPKPESPAQGVDKTHSPTESAPSPSSVPIYSESNPSIEDSAQGSDKIQSPTESAPSSSSVQISAESTPSVDIQPLKEATIPVFLIKIRIKRAQLRETHKLSATVADFPVDSSFPVIARIEFSGDKFEEYMVSFNTDQYIPIRQNMKGELARILFYGQKPGMLALRHAGSKRTSTGIFRSVLCFPIGDDSKSLQTLSFVVEAAIGVATFTVRATNDIIQRNSRLVSDCKQMTRKNGDRYVPSRYLDPEKIVPFDPNVLKFAQELNIFESIGGVWRPDSFDRKGIVSYFVYVGTGEGDFKVPISRNHGEIHRVGFNNTPYSERKNSPEKEPIFFYDVWANLAFGYFLKLCGYCPEGAALFARELGLGSDDPTDQKAIQKGASLESFIESSILHAVLSDRDFFYEERAKWTPLCV